MQGPFYATRAYMYGNTFFDPEVPYYNNTRYHKKPAPREFPDRRQFDDGTEYKEYDPNLNDGGVTRVHIPNIINCETWMEKRLHMVFYGITEEDDKEVLLEIGNRYAIQYITENGIKTADGYLRLFSTSIPDTNCRYANNLSDEALQAWIGIDCSKEGVSDKRRIYINSIRDVTSLEPTDTYEAPVETMTVGDMLTKILAKVNTLKNCDCKPITQKILDLVIELKEAGINMTDLDLDGDGIISFEELNKEGQEEPNPAELPENQPTDNDDDFNLTDIDV